MKKKVTLLGSTGSIGLSTLSVLSLHPEQFEIFALTGNKQLACLVQQCLDYRPRYVVIADEASAKLFHQLTAHLSLSSEILVGELALCEVAQHPDVDIVMAAIAGSAGLMPTLAAINANKKILLANKETLVMAGELILAALAQSTAQLLPVDSEHSAIFQCLPEKFCDNRLFPSRVSNQAAVNNFGLAKLILTASGGAIRDLPLAQLPEVLPEIACTHPNWSMGKKITVDSATMMNKALEVIETYYLFGMPWQKIEVILHPQSIVHALVYYEDASVIAQLGLPDMRTPIAAALAWPDRLTTSVPTLDLTQMTQLTFLPLDSQRYPCFDLAYQALEMGGAAATVLNAVNEVAVACFLNKQISFTDIYKLNQTILTEMPLFPANDLEAIKAIDFEARQLAAVFVQRLKSV